MRRLATAMVTIIVAASCSGGGAEPVDRLVVVGNDGEVLTVAPDGSEPVVLSEEGTTGFQPVWSPDATQIAWGSLGGEVAALAVADVASGDVSVAATENNPFYVSWAPEGDRLGLLRNDSDGLAFETATVDDGGVTITTQDTGAPYYFAWRPDGERVVSHVGADRFDVLDLDGDITPTGLSPGPFQAPQWIDRGIITFAGNAEGGDVVLMDEEGATEPIAAADGLVYFAADPEGERLAVFSLSLGGDAESVAMVDGVLAPNVLSVIDLEDGSLVEVTDQPVAAFQWSPDGERLLILQAGSFPGDVQWIVWSDEETIEGPEFAPLSHWVNDYLPFHDQYARSMTLWSPDGESFAFAGLIDDRAGIWRHDLVEDETTFVIDGTWVVWSPV